MHCRMKTLVVPALVHACQAPIDHAMLKLLSGLAIQDTLTKAGIKADKVTAVSRHKVAAVCGACCSPQHLEGS